MSLMFPCRNTKNRAERAQCNFKKLYTLPKRVLSSHAILVMHLYPCEDYQHYTNNREQSLIVQIREQIIEPGNSVGIATGYELDGPGIESRWEARFSAPVQTGAGAHPASCTMDTGSFSGVKSGRGVTLTPHPFLVSWSRKSRAIPLLPLWVVRPVQSLSACTRVHFTLPLLLRQQITA